MHLVGFIIRRSQYLLLPQFDDMVSKSVEKSPAGSEKAGIFFIGSKYPIGQGLVII
jgi:hypothetical protein